MSAETLTIERLERWTLSGGSWRVREISSARVVVDLCACTGEPMQRLRSEDPAVIAHLRTAPSSLDDDHPPVGPRRHLPEGQGA